MSLSKTPSPHSASAPRQPAPSREDRLAQRLRENLRRRKAQARALSAEENEAQSRSEAADPAPPLTARDDAENG